MTAIVGLVKNNVVWMGGDSLVSYGYQNFILADPKVFIKKDVMFGLAGSAKQADLLANIYNLPLRDENLTDKQYLFGPVARSVRELLRSEGALETVNAVEKLKIDGLLGYRGNLYRLASDFSILDFKLEFQSVGSGSEVAMGAMYAQRPFTKPEQAIATALSAAAEFSVGVRGPFTILKLEPSKNG